MGRVAVWWWAAPAVLLVLGMHYGGIAAGSIYAFTDWRGIGPFKFVGLDNFINIFRNPKASQALWNTLLLAGGFLVLTNVIGMAFAVALNRQLKSRHLLRTLLFMPVVLSPLAVSYIWKFIFQPQGPLNDLLRAVGLEDQTRAWLGDPSSAIWTILIVMVWQHIGLTMVLYLAGLANVPMELEEASAVDGAGAWRRFFHIVLPLLRPTIVVASTLILVQGLRVFDQVQAMTAGGPFNATETLSTLVYKETFVSGRYGYGAALSLLLTVLIAVFAVLQIVLLRGKKEEN
ncbi:Carbohydrate ABC transporter membrane protein 1, CUT1 family [Arthrobacter sp. 9AX]|uniref:carbohydrate ABC transporter permease n=1 Tax=Arthrobacter sp. 9AX TaxID=2653131 RepID=UPI0012EF3D01|nr:sugar ABC transporter permease [Arthrobacter sp. 9AX]VXC24342.1 Carbohydrate ABC transporter membrane protein 1, CUT1 family [Arthrobacter sp. 9AX]